MPLPELTPEQRAFALNRAMEIRAERARLAESIRTGEIPLAEALSPDGLWVGHGRRR